MICKILVFFTPFIFDTNDLLDFSLLDYHYYHWKLTWLEFSIFQFDFLSDIHIVWKLVIVIILLMYLKSTHKKILTAYIPLQIL